MRRAKRMFAIGVILILGLVMIGLNSSNAGAKTIGVDFANADGRVADFTSSKIKYRVRLGSSPEKWSKLKTLKINSKTKFYKCTGYTESYSKYKIKKYSKAKAKKEIFNNSSNYVYFKKKNGKASLVVFGMENYVG